MSYADDHITSAGDRAAYNFGVANSTVEQDERDARLAALAISVGNYADAEAFIQSILDNAARARKLYK